MIIKRRPFTATVAVVLLAGVLVVPAVSAAGRPSCLVSNERTGLGSGSLQQGIDAAAPGDTLVVKGTCLGASSITKDLTIKGVSNRAFREATLDGEGLVRVLFVETGLTVTVADLTITNGFANDGNGGGGLLSRATNLTLKESKVAGNTATVGGGGIENDSNLTIVNSTVSGNAADLGGGILSSGALTLVNSTVSGNTAHLGGGLFNVLGTATLTRSTVSGNSALQGGGVSNDFGGTLTLTSSIVTGNAATAASGGGIFNHSAMTITGSMVNGNSAPWAAGVSNYGALAFASPSTIVGSNAASSAPGGVFNYSGVGTVMGGCPTALGGHVIYSLANTPTDYVGFSCPMPVPQLAMNGTEDYIGSDGNPYMRYRLTITNWADYAPDLFAPAPDLAPCGLNNSASRTWLNIYRAADSSYIYGFCGLSAPTDLTQIWFAVPRGSAPPVAVYVTLTDRRTGQTVTSNTVSFTP